MDLREVGYDDGDWIDLAQNRERWRAYPVWERECSGDHLSLEADLQPCPAEYDEKMILKLIRKRERNWLGEWLRRNCLLKDALEGMVNGRRVRGKRRCQMIDYIKIYELHAEIKRKAEIGKIGEWWICNERPALGQKTTNE
ncbi:hypothetical protein ANN_23679 [Periplaneta americana]|uniref:Uncharacterized protein n=1 Tax=Periplaneta americana TaxID=6978 RepID=A0ABQ8SLR2_PERAM|nr:hypothetical protein ANN_23679 [Periplaneta americana]